MDPSSSQHTERVREITEIEGERETPNHMQPYLYEAVMNGNDGYLEQHIDLFDTQLTPNHNTILHVAALFGKSESVAKILEKKPNQIRQANKNHENPLHIAVREQHYDIVEALINGAEKLDQDPESGGGTLLQMLTATNVDGDTPLHLAVREGDNEFVILLVNKYNAFQHPPYTHNACQRPNKAGETPLFLAAERNNGDSMVESILSCESPDYTGPSGRTAFHAAAISGKIENIKKLARKELISMADTQGWTPLHIAAAAGNVAVMEEILSHCPDCWEMVNKKRQNILHIAVDSKADCVIDYIRKNDFLLKILMNKKDVKGNTPLHLLASSKLKHKDEVINHPRANMYVVNNKNMTPADVAMSIKQNSKSSSSWKARGLRNIGSNEEQVERTEDFLIERERKESREVKAENQISQSHVLVAILIATITFTAAFAVPGGYNGYQGPDEGLAVLAREAAFKSFLLANTTAVMCSISSALVYVFATFYDDEDERKKCYMRGFSLLLIAIVAMTVGFISGIYATLVHSLGLNIGTSVLASIWFLIYLNEPLGLYLYCKSQGQKNN